jgi:hypothetical protein
MQAWAFSCGVRHILHKNPTMWLRDFPHDVWVLHRKLHHRYLKHRKSFRAATEKGLADSIEDSATPQPAKKPKGPMTISYIIPHMIAHMVSHMISYTIPQVQ